LQAPTGSGKTVMGIYMVCQRKQKTLIIVHTKELLYQWIERIKEFTTVPENEVGIIGDGHETIGDRITVGMVQSVYKRTKTLSKVFGHVVVDEAHRCPSRTFTEAVSSFSAKYLLGLTATAYRRDGLSKCIFLYLGPLRHQVENESLYASGHILQPEFIMRPTEFIPHYDPQVDYVKMLSELTKDPERNKLICRDIASYRNKSKCCMVLTDRKEHCHELQLLLKRYKVNASVLTGETKQKERKRIVSNIKPDGIRFVIATGQLIGEGFDCKGLDVLFLASPVKYSGRVIQYIGRVMRSVDGKEKPIVYDYVDWNVKVLATSAKGRIRIYGKENVTHR